MLTRPWAGWVDVRGFPGRIDEMSQQLGVSLGERTTRSFFPPDRLVVTAPADQPDRIAPYLDWLSLAASVLLVLDHEGEAPDAEMIALVDSTWDDVAAQLGNVVARFHSHPGPRGGLAVALDRVQDLGPAPDRVSEEPASTEQRRWPSGPWLSYEGSTSPAALASSLYAHASGPAVMRADGPRSLLQPSTGPLRLLTRPPSHPYCEFDPFHPVVFSGLRFNFVWHVRHGGKVAELCASDHDFPCGHCKEPWGYSDNRPVSVALAPDLGAYVSLFVHDAMISTAVPMTWRMAGDLAVSDWGRQPDPLRALLFCTGPRGYGDPSDPREEDVRDHAPMVVLGPDDACRYAVDLTDPTWRILGRQVEQLPEGGYAVYDANHALVRRGEGRLLGGWFRWATVLHQGQLWREDLTTGEREALGPPDRDILWAVSVPGTVNVVIVTEGALRLV